MGGDTPFSNHEHTSSKSLSEIPLLSLRFESCCKSKYPHRTPRLIQLLHSGKFSSHFTLLFLHVEQPNFEFLCCLRLPYLPAISTF